MKLKERAEALAASASLRSAVGIAVVSAGLLLVLLSFRVGQHDAERLERDLASAQLEHIGSAVAAARRQLAATARALAGNEGLIRGADGAAIASLTAASVDLADRPFDTILVTDADRNPHYAAAWVQGQLAEQSPDPRLLAYLASLPGGPADVRPGDMAEVMGDRFVAAHPIVARGGALGTVGWLVLSRSVASLPAPLAALQGAAPGQPFAAEDLRRLDEEARRRLATPNPHGSAFRIAVGERSGGYAVLSDRTGRPAWMWRVPSHASSVRRDGFDSAAAIAGAVLLALLGGAIVLALRRYLRRQRSLDARYKAIIDQTNDGIVIVDASTHHVQYCNPAFLLRLGYTHEEAQSLTLSDIFADGATSAESVLSRLRNADSKLALNLQQRCKTGLLVDVEVRCNTLDVDGRAALAYVVHDVSLRRKAEQQLLENQQRLDKIAHHDQLTGLPNRHYLATFLPQAIAEAAQAGAILGVVFLDLDRFKHINDTRGHEVGDKLLQEVASRLRTCVRGSDVVIRMGGDEFVVIFRHVKTYEEVTQGAARMVDTLNRPIVIDQHPLQTSGSVGVSLFPRDGADMGELLKHSDTAMYQAKERGRNNVQLFNPLMNRKLKQRVAMEAALREALRLKQLDVHYQPFVNLSTRKIIGLEALMRWRHPQHGMVPADQFIPVAEETGLIVPMGNFVLHRTLQTMSAWRKSGVALVPVSLNVAPAQLQRSEFQATLSTLLKSHDFSPHMLQLEMTERAVFDSSQAKSGDGPQDTMARLRDLGVKIAIDDFGTGYSSLSYLKNWRVDALKIDRSFVRDLVTDSSDLAIVSAIIAIARHLKIQVIAEGIEAYQQADILLKLGCSVGQGFLFARPMPAEDCVKLLGDQTADPEEEDDMLAAFAAGRA